MALLGEFVCIAFYISHKNNRIKLAKVRILLIPGRSSQSIGLPRRVVRPWRSSGHETYGAPMQRGQAPYEGNVRVAQVNGRA